MLETTSKRHSRHRNFWTPVRLALLFWLSMVAATAIPLWLWVDRSAVAVATVGVAILIGAILSAFLRAEAELRAELERTEAILQDQVTDSQQEWRR
jgi:hypothetical protein